MTLPQVPAYLVAAIAASSVLAALGPAFVYDPTEDQETSKSRIGNALKTNGVFFEIGFPRVMSPETALDGSTKVDVACPVFVTEDIQRVHTPKLLALVNEVILACTARPTASQKPARLQMASSEITENGYILHSFFFYVPLNIKPSSSLSSPQV
jgi:hypothetical protein